MIANLEQSAAAAAVGVFTDEHLMEMISAHDPRGLHLLHERYAILLKSICMTVLHNDADAEDQVQVVFLEIWDMAANYDPSKGRPLSWIATLTRRRAIDRLRRRDAYCRVEDRFAEERMHQSDTWTHVHEDVSQVERSVRLQHALAKLPEAQRSAITLAYHGEMTQREIATFTGIPLGTIKTRLELGLKKLAVSLRRFEDRPWGENHAARA